MIDLHCHIIFDVDDGSASLEESMQMLKEAEKAGFTDVVLTSHYLENYYEVSTEEIIEKMKALENEISNRNMNIRLHIGREIYITPDINKAIINGEISTLNNSRYVLVEMPMSNRILYLEHELQQLMNNGFIPILAHPERYKIVQKDFDYLDDLKRMGVLFQINYGSILGKYGAPAKKTVKKMLKKGMVDFVGSDCHTEGSLYTYIDKAMKKISKLVSSKELKQITELNAREILENS